MINKALVNWDNQKLNVKFFDAPRSVLKPNELRIKNSCVALEDIDLFKKRSEGEDFLGYSGCGVIEEVGKDVVQFSVGERVAYITPKGDALGVEVCINMYHAIRVPEVMSDIEVVGVFYKSCMTHMLTSRVFIINEGSIILIHDASSALSVMMCKYAKFRGAKKVFGTFNGSRSNNEKVFSLFDGVVDYTKKEWASELKNFDLCKNGVHVVYDGIGGPTFVQSIQALCTLGVMIGYDSIESKIDKVPMSLLQSNSIYFIFPSIFDCKIDCKIPYCDEPYRELFLTGMEMFKYIQDYDAKPPIKSFNFDMLEQAFSYALTHRDTATVIQIACSFNYNRKSEEVFIKI